MSKQDKLMMQYKVYNIRQAKIVQDKTMHANTMQSHTIQDKTITHYSIPQDKIIIYYKRDNNIQNKRRQYTMGQSKTHNDNIIQHSTIRYKITHFDIVQ